MGERYHFEDVWTIPASIDRAWRLIDDVAGWPRWWPDYRRMERVSTDAEHGVGVRWRARVKANLPYTLDFEFTVLAHEPPNYVKTYVEGFFTGEIDWRLESYEAGTVMTLLEDTETRWPLINLVARLGGRRLLEANHRWAMRRGETGMRAILATGYEPPAPDT